MSHDGSILDAHTVEFKRLLPGPIELAWDHLTKPELLKTWFGDVTLEPRVGGKVEIRFGSEACDAAGGVRGVVREFRAPHVIAFSWNQLRLRPDGSRGPVDEGEVRFELAERGDKVLLTLLHSGLPTKELASHGAGWHAYLDNLGSRLSGAAAVDMMEAYSHLHPRYDDKVAAVLRQGAA